MIELTKKLPTAFILFLGVGTGISMVKFIPSWEDAHELGILILFAMAVLTGLAYLIGIWINTYKSKKRNNWLKALFLSTLVVVGFILSYFISFWGDGLFLPSLKMTKKINNYTFYIYEDACWIPESSCECDYYRSLIYVQNKHLPIMHLKKVINFYVDTIELVNNKVIVKASVSCERDKYKKAVINME